MGEKVKSSRTILKGINYQMVTSIFFVIVIAFNTALIPLLRILTGKKHRQIKLQRLQKVQIWAFGSLVYQIKSLLEVLKLKQNF